VHDRSFHTRRIYLGEGDDVSSQPHTPAPRMPKGDEAAQDDASRDQLPLRHSQLAEVQDAGRKDPGVESRERAGRRLLPGECVDARRAHVRDGAALLLVEHAAWVKGNNLGRGVIGVTRLAQDKR
jgi:hypothetical protein